MEVDTAARDREEDTLAGLRAQLREAHETLDAIRFGEVDAVLVRQAGSSKIFTLVNADRPYRFLIEQMIEGAVTLSEEGVVLYGNRRLGEIIDAPLERIVGSNIKRFLAESEVERFDALLRATGSAPSRAEFLVQRPGKTPVPICLSINDIVSDAGAPRLIGGVLTDLTLQHELEARVSQGQKMEAVGQLTGGLAHDFNNLLQAISGNLNLIEGRPGEADKVRTWAANGLKAAERGAKLTKQLLAFSRTQEIDIQAVNVADLVAGMADLLLRTLGAAIDIGYELERSGISVMADKTQLELAILNMAINGRDAMPGGGQLLITTRLCHMDGDSDLLRGEYLELSVADTGCGMPESVRSRAFDPFFTTKRVGEGTGLGLAQVYGIARQSGGAARIVSSSGAGTTVTLLLRQCAVVPVSAANDAGAGRATGARAGTTLLVVDDDDLVREMLVECLLWAGYRVRQAESGAAALELMAQQLPDVLVADYMMPGMSGAELVKQARALGYTMPVIFATGFAQSGALDEAVGGKAHVLAKPFSPEELAAAIESVLLQARAHAHSFVGATPPGA
jgi:signal transduction histidine kinase/CheY-like chemotaxis protein